MPKFTIEVAIQGFAIYTVDADSPEEARDADDLQLVDSEWDWNTQEHRGGHISITEEPKEEA